MNRIAELRHERGLTQDELGSIIGKTKFALSKWEAGSREPSQGDIAKLCEVLGADAGYLMGHSDTNTRRIELRDSQIPQELRDAGLEAVVMLKEYVDENGGIRVDVRRELLRLLAEAKDLPENEPRHKRARRSQGQK